MTETDRKVKIDRHLSRQTYRQTDWLTNRQWHADIKRQTARLDWGGFSPTGSRWPSLMVFMARLQPIRNFFMGPSSSSWKIEAIIKIHPLFFKFLSLSNLYFALTNEKINEKLFWILNEKVYFCKKYPLLPSENVSENLGCYKH